MTDYELRVANNLKSQIYALEQAVKIPKELRDNPEIAINKGTDNAVFIPRSLNKRIFALIEEELSSKRIEFENLCNPNCK